MDQADPLASINEKLTQGEKMIWSGKPTQGLLLTWRDGFMIPFSLLWGGFAFYWESLVLRSNAPPQFVIFGIPFVLIGLFLIFGRFLFDSWLRAQTIYVVTNYRVLIVRSGPWPSFTALNLERLPEMTLFEKGDGKGTIRFGPSIGFLTMNRSFASWIPVLDPVPQFLGIDDVGSVFAEIEKQSANLSRHN